MKDLPEALPPTTFEQTLHNMIISLAQGTLQREAILQLRRLSADHDVSDEAKQDHDSNYEFWTKDKLFNRLFGAIQDNLKLSVRSNPEHSLLILISCLPELGRAFHCSGRSDTGTAKRPCSSSDCVLFWTRDSHVRSTTIYSCTTSLSRGQ